MKADFRGSVCLVSLEVKEETLLMATQPPVSYWLFVNLCWENQFEGYRAISYLCTAPDRGSVETQKQDQDSDLKIPFCVGPDCKVWSVD